MLTNLRIRNFKRFDDVEIPLTHPVVFIGPNNSGKTTALQAIALWSQALDKLSSENILSQELAAQPITLNRLELTHLPTPIAQMLWRDLQVSSAGTSTPFEIEISGDTYGIEFSCGIRFNFVNQESLNCSLSQGTLPDVMQQVAYLPPMSGLVSVEDRLQPGSINVRLGEGRTAEILRNLCLELLERNLPAWENISRRIRSLFDVELDSPSYNPARGQITMSYRQRGIQLDLTSSGRGLQQTLLLLAFLHRHPGSVLLLDEPDAHLEILRQKRILQELNEVSAETSSQLIVASHSEAVMDSAAELNPDSVIAFLGKPRQVPAKNRTQLRKWLVDTPFHEFFLAEQQGWVLYSENFTDLSILRAFAQRLNHPSATYLAQPFQRSIGNQPNQARQHFAKLALGLPSFRGVLIVDRDAPGLQDRPELREHKWHRREIENYLCQPNTLVAFAESLEVPEAGALMQTALADRVPPAALRDPNDAWWRDTKASDEFLDLVLPRFFESLGRRNELPKSEYHRLAQFVPLEQIDDEIRVVLDLIAATAAPPPKPNAPTPA